MGGAVANDILVTLLTVTLVGLALPTRVGRSLRRFPAAHRAARVVGHGLPILLVPVGLLLIGLEGTFLPALLALAGYLVGAVRSAHLRVPRLTAEASLLHPWFEIRDALAKGPDRAQAAWEGERAVALPRLARGARGAVSGSEPAPRSN